MKTAAKIIELVTARLQVLPEDAKIAIAGHGTFSKHELISHVQKDTPTGQTICEIELKYLKSLKKGIFYA